MNTNARPEELLPFGFVPRGRNCFEANVQLTETSPDYTVKIIMDAEKTASGGISLQVTDNTGYKSEHDLISDAFAHAKQLRHKALLEQSLYLHEGLENSLPVQAAATGSARISKKSDRPYLHAVQYIRALWDDAQELRHLKAAKDSVENSTALALRDRRLEISGTLVTLIALFADQVESLIHRAIDEHDTVKESEPDLQSSGTGDNVLRLRAAK